MLTTTLFVLHQAQRFVSWGKDGCHGIRLAVDYCCVNKFTVDDAYPLPDIQSIYQSVSKSTMISVTGCKQGYWQLKFKNLPAEFSQGNRVPSDTLCLGTPIVEAFDDIGNLAAMCAWLLAPLETIIIQLGVCTSLV